MYGGGMSLNILERQRNNIAQIFDLKDRTSNDLQNQDFWKLLIYDQKCQDIIGPLMKVGSLRQHGVTLHLPLFADRTKVNEAPAVYLIEPNEANINRLIEDMKNKLYKKYYVNFSTSASNSLLQKFAYASAQSNVSHYVAQVVDCFVQFVSISSSEFTLDMPKVFQSLHSAGQDSEIESLITTIVDRLFCVIITLGVVPIIRCPIDSSKPAHVVGQRLHSRLKSLFSERGGKAATLFGTASLNTHVLERPILILVDREIDFYVMLRHTWTYEGLIHDLFKLKRNRVSVPVVSNHKTQLKTYDLDASDSLWSEYGKKSFPEAAVAISDALTEYNSRMGQLGHKQQITPNNIVHDLQEGHGTSELSAAINALPEMTEMKRSIDLHTNIATAVVSEITTRSLDKFFEFEDTFDSINITSALNQLEKLLQSSEKGTIHDKIRTLICFYLMKPQLTSQQLVKLRGIIQKEQFETKAIDFLQRLDSFKALQQSQQQLQQQNISGNATAVQHPAALWGTNLIDRSRGLLEGVRSLLPMKRTLPLTRLVETLLENKVTTDPTIQYSYLDPKTSAQLGLSDDQTPKLKTPFRQSIVFVVGGGSFIESHALKEIATKDKKQILYGCTDFVSPEDFLSELEILGQSI